MRKSFLVFAVIGLAACASSNNNLKVNIAQPSVVVEQLSSQPTVAEHVTGGIPIYLGVAVTNNADIPITLKRVNLQSMGTGGYNVPPTSRPFNKVIQPGATEQVEFWVPAYADPSVAGVNGAVALRSIVQFDTSQGSFQNTTVHQVQGIIR